MANSKRDFAYSRRLIGMRPFIHDNGAPGLYITWKEHEGEGSVSLIFLPEELDHLQKTLDGLRLRISK